MPSRNANSVAAGREVLDGFCYTGGFALNAAAGARSVTAADSSAEALELARRSASLNAQPAVNWLEGDVFQLLRKFRDEGRVFDLVVLDPPKFAPTAAHVAKAARAYKDINLLAFKLLRPGGLLVTFSCSGGVSAELFQKIVAGAALSGWARLTFKRVDAEIYPWSPTHSSFVTSGPFRISRNPMYLGILVIGVGAALVAGTWLMWLVPVLLFVLDNFVIIPFEERSMEQTFGDTFRAYRGRVRRCLTTAATVASFTADANIAIKHSNATPQGGSSASRPFPWVQARSAKGRECRALSGRRDCASRWPGLMSPRQRCPRRRGARC